MSKEPVAPSAVALGSGLEKTFNTPRALTEPEIKELIRRFDRAPKPMYYQPDFLHAAWAEYLEANSLTENMVDPDAFVRWTYARALAHRQPLYRAMADNWGLTIAADTIATVRSGSGAEMRAVQPAKTSRPIFSTESGIAISRRLVQPEKALGSMTVTVSGMALSQVDWRSFFRGFNRLGPDGLFFLFRFLRLDFLLLHILIELLIDKVEA